MLWGLIKGKAVGCLSYYDLALVCVSYGPYPNLVSLALTSQILKFILQVLFGN